MTSDLRVAIIGAGIGGLTAAKALQVRGANVQIFEKAPALKPIGSGITLQSNAMQALAQIGLAETVREAGATIQHAQFMLRSGRVLTELDMAKVAEPLGQPGVCIHRGLLQQLLIESVGSRFIQTGVELQSWGEKDSNVLIELNNGERGRYDLLIGADGLRSDLRTRLWGSHSLRRARYTTWRGTCANDGLVKAGHAVESWGAGQRFGYLPVDDERLYWFAADSTAIDSVDPDEVLLQLIRRFANWHAPVPKILRRTEPRDILHSDVYDLRPFSPWGKGRVTLLGDAAHPMTPNFGQGGCQAIEDAVILAAMLDNGVDITAQLRTYERHRQQRTKVIVRESRLFGQLAQGETLCQRWIRNTMFALMPSAMQQSRLQRLLTCPTHETSKTARPA